MNPLRFLKTRLNLLKPFSQRFKTRNSVTHVQQPIAQAATKLELNDITSSLLNNGAENYKYYSSLRIYQNHTWFDLTNLIVMTTCCSSDFFVDNCGHLYNLSRKLMGIRLSEFAVANTMGRIYTSGNSLKAMQEFITIWRHPNVNILMSYSNEAPPELVTKELLDENAKAYVASVDLCSMANQNNNGSAFKCSSLCPLETLKKSNKAQLRLREIFSKGFGNLTQTYTAQELSDILHKMNIQFTFTDFQEFLSLFLNKQVTQDTMDAVTISKFEWLKDVHMFSVRDGEKNNNYILRQITNLIESDLVELERFSQRLNSIFERAALLKQKVLVDAEQSYMQATIDSFAVQYSNIYNKEIAIILNTYQNYLKSTKERLVYELQRCKSLNLPFGAKMVRGAYMVEERRLAKEQGYEDPILDTIEDTHNNYNSNLEFLISNWIQGSQVLIASHNEQSVLWGKHLVKKYDINSSKGFISFAQLLGLGDHLTFSLAKEGYTVGKMCHFGPLHYMVPFLIRRAQESKQVLASSSLKRRLALNEIGYRIKLH